MTEQQKITHALLKGLQPKMRGGLCCVKEMLGDYKLHWVVYEPEEKIK